MAPSSGPMGGLQLRSGRTTCGFEFEMVASMSPGPGTAMVSDCASTELRRWQLKGRIGLPSWLAITRVRSRRRSGRATETLSRPTVACGAGASCRQGIQEVQKIDMAVNHGHVSLVPNPTHQLVSVVLPRVPSLSEPMLKQASSLDSVGTTPIAGALFRLCPFVRSLNRSNVH